MAQSDSEPSVRRNSRSANYLSGRPRLGQIPELPHQGKSRYGRKGMADFGRCAAFQLEVAAVFGLEAEWLRPLRSQRSKYWYRFSPGLIPACSVLATKTPL